MYPPANTVNHQAKIRFSKIARTVYILAFHFLSTVHVRVYHDYPTRCLPTSSPRMHLQKHSLRSGLFWNTFQSSFWKKESHFNLPGSTVWVNQLWYSRVWFWALNKVTRLSSIIRTHPGPYKQAKVFSISVLISPRYSIFKFENSDPAVYMTLNISTCLFEFETVLLRNSWHFFTQAFSFWNFFMKY